ncbi:MAG: 30S ribosomal protein S20 [Candidatus Shapirobacteria bacterium]
MPISLSTKKSLRKSQKNRKANGIVRKKVKEIIALFLEKPTEGNLKAVFSIVDKAAKVGIFHRKKAARLKSRLAKKIANKIEVTAKKELSKKEPVKKKTVKKSVK